MRIIDALDGTVYGEGDTRAAAYENAIETAYCGNEACTEADLDRLFSEYQRTGGATGLYYDDSEDA
jgi:hypothetical protein